MHVQGFVGLSWGYSGPGQAPYSMAAHSFLDKNPRQNQDRLKDAAKSSARFFSIVSIPIAMDAIG
jgi:hypothetical protein